MDRAEEKRHPNPSLRSVAGTIKAPGMLVTTVVNVSRATSRDNVDKGVRGQAYFILILQQPNSTPPMYPSE